MRFLDRIFGNNQPLKECPRCLGKGHVDTEDIKRLKQELMWQPGVCAYCNGSGKINPKIETKVPVDASYLVMDIPESERKKVLSGHAEATAYAKKQYGYAVAIVDYVYKLHTERGLTPSEIADFLLRDDETSTTPEDKRKKVIEYVEKVIKDRTPK